MIAMKVRVMKVRVMKVISKLLAYSIAKVKAYEEFEEIEPMDIKISFFTTPEQED